MRVDLRVFGFARFVRHLVVGLGLLTGGAVNAQKIGYADSKYILEKLPTYATAQQEVNRLSAGWQKEIEQKRLDIDRLNRDYKLSEPLLRDEQKKKRLDEIAKKETEAREFQQKTFGFEGTVFKKRQELMKPVYDQVFAAFEKVAKQKQLAIIFDKSGDVTMLYTNPTHDYTEYVLEELGIKSPEKNQPGRPPAGADDKQVDLPGGGDKENGAGNDIPAQPAEDRPAAPGSRKP
ncbi:MAG: OmpH family outer membrane protein [Hymenobacteraceae bacterium]|nr:OmpH family outer membrane protein [Hymenobacteraceae bacterium]